MWNNACTPYTMNVSLVKHENLKVYVLQQICHEKISFKVFSLTQSVGWILIILVIFLVIEIKYPTSKVKGEDIYCSP